MEDRSQTSQTDLFLSLTPDKVLEAVEAAGLKTNPVCYPLNAYENRVYEVELEDRKRIIAKFYRPGRWSREQILEEHRFLADLDAEEVPVGTVHPFPNGDTLRQIDHIFYSLFDRRGGRAPDELSDAQVHRLGMLVARIHNVGARHSAPHRLRLDADTYVRQSLAWLEEHAALPVPFRHRYLEVAEELAEITDALMKGVETQRIHGDLHLGNLLDRDGVFHVLDFDDMVTGPPVQDLWLALPGRDQETLRLREVFLEGYEQLRLFERSTLVLIEALRGLRLVHFSTWLARRWHDPAFPAAWPHFGSEGYWEQECEGLEEVVTLLRRQGVEGFRAPAEEEALSNKDYFWDWEDS